MKLGIDFGTTRIVVAAADRGNYPVIAFEASDGSTWDWFPPLVAVRGARRRYGWQAWLSQQEEGWILIRSLKRILQDAGPETRVVAGDQAPPLMELLSEMTGALRAALQRNSSLAVGEGEPLEAMLGVPANANSNQRFLTVEAFRRSGFTVLGLLNEPSAAGIEFGHREKTAGSRQRNRILVYDLGGGTFDASLVDMEDQEHSIAGSEGIPTLGGDDFDAALAEMAMEAAGLSPDCLSQTEFFLLHEECRQKKEALHPNTRKLSIDLDNVRPGLGEVSIAVSDFYERCRPMVDETIHAVEDLLAGQQAPDDPMEALYVTGGGSELPLVARVLRERFGRRVRRSAYTRSATAIGLAIQADTQAGYILRERFLRHFGVWREAEGGSIVVFDPLFDKGVSLPGPGQPALLVTRHYSPVHNVGHFRYLECTSRGGAGQPSGDITVWDEIRFPFDPGLADVPDLAAFPVEHSPAAARQRIEESYACDAGGGVTVTISNLTAEYSRSWRLGRWAPREQTIVPGRKRRSGKR